MADPRETHMVDGMWIQRQINFGLDKKSHSLIARCPKSALFKYCQLIISVMVMACIFILTSRHWMRYWEEVHGIMKNWKLAMAKRFRSGELKEADPREMRMDDMSHLKTRSHQTGQLVTKSRLLIAKLNYKQFSFSHFHVCVYVFC